MIHRDLHPVDAPGCFACKVLSIGISAHALETKGRPVVAIDQKEKRWQKDHHSYRQLRKNGLQPKQIDGSSATERHAEHPMEVELGRALPKRQIEALEEACS